MVIHKKIFDGMVQHTFFRISSFVGVYGSLYAMVLATTKMVGSGPINIFGKKLIII